MAIPSAPLRPVFAFFHVNRIPDTPFGVIVLMDFLNSHRTSFRVSLTFASNTLAYKFAIGGLRFGGGESIGTFHAREHSGMGLVRPMGGSQQPLTGNGQLQTEKPPTVNL